MDLEAGTDSYRIGPYSPLDVLSMGGVCMNKRAQTPAMPDLIFLFPREETVELGQLDVDKKALAVEALADYVRILQAHGRSSSEVRRFLENHRDIWEELELLVEMANFFDSIKEVETP